MAGSHPTAGTDSVIELSSDDLIEVADRASLLHAAEGAQNIARLTGTHGVVMPPLLRPKARLPLPAHVHAGAQNEVEDPELGRLHALVDSRADDPVGALRAHLELAFAE